MRPSIYAIAILITLGGALPVQAQDAGSAEAFIRQLYTRYANDPQVSPFADVRSVRGIATPGLAQLVQRGQGGLEADPVCGCQDAEGLKLNDVAVAVLAAGQATATANLQFGPDRVARRFSLRAVGTEWRIDDITSGNGRNSLRAALSKPVADLQRQRR